jgi:hypothetical protein
VRSDESWRLRLQVLAGAADEALAGQGGQGLVVEMGCDGAETV